MERQCAYDVAEERSSLVGKALRDAYKSRIEIEGSAFILAELAKNASELSAAIIKYVYWEKPCEEAVKAMARMLVVLEQAMIVFGDFKINIEKEKVLNEIFSK